MPQYPITTAPHRDAAPGAAGQPDAGGAVMNGTVLLAGIVGSTAYGLAGPDSDVDRLGVFAAPTIAFHGLSRPTDTYTTSRPDSTLHEAAKWAGLALQGNPTVMELVWLPERLYETRTDLGDELIDLRAAFLCRKRVRDAYLGYATQQFKRLESRGDGPAAGDARQRVAKHARHLARLVHQGTRLYETGRLEVELEDPGWFHAFGERVATEGADAARRVLAGAEERFDGADSPLPEQPDHRGVEQWLLGVRRRFWEG